jgi:hypothetical protein
MPVALRTKEDFGCVDLDEPNPLSIFQRDRVSIDHVIDPKDRHSARAGRHWRNHVENDEDGKC